MAGSTLWDWDMSGIPSQAATAIQKRTSLSFALSMPIAGTTLSL